MSRNIITIDGPAASGKSTVARQVAQQLGYAYLDTGAMYRAVTLACMRTGVDLENPDAVLAAIDAHTFEFVPQSQHTVVTIDHQDVTEAIRSPEVTAQVRFVAQAPAVRECLVQMQQSWARTHAGMVTEGRDQGTVVFPDARVKIFLTADPQERARRRKAELDAKGIPQDLEELQKTVDARDKSDRERHVGPLKPAPDAIVIDTTPMTLDDVVRTILGYIEQWREHE